MASTNNHFKLTLDTIAPSCSFSNYAGSKIVNSQVSDLGLNVGGSGVLKAVWTDQVSAPVLNKFTTGTAYAVGDIIDYESDIYKVKEAFTAGSTLPENKVTAIAWTNATETQQVSSGFEAQGSNYVHAVAKDAVNNLSSIATSVEFTFDTVDPVISAVSISDATDHSKTITNNNTNFYIEFTVTDVSPSSGLQSACITGDCLAKAITADVDKDGKVSQSLPWKTNIVDGSYRVTVSISDKAGNKAVAVQSNELILDTNVGTVNAQLYVKGTTTSLPTWISYAADASPSFSSREIDVAISCDATDIVAYKVVEAADAEAAETAGTWTSYTSGQAFSKTETYTVSANDGEKYVFAVVKDSAGNIQCSDKKTIKVDSVKPTATMSASQPKISNVTAYSTSVISTSGSDASSELKSTELYCGSTKISAFTLGTDITVSSTDITALTEGNNVFKLVLIDNAGNKTEKSVNILLDTTAPAITINQLGGTYNGWYSKEFNTAAVITEDGAGFTNAQDKYNASGIWIWTNKVANDTNAEGNNKGITAAGTYNISSTAIAGTLQQGEDYLHVKVVDAVGNAGYAHQTYYFDSVGPELDVQTPIAFTKAAYSTANAKVIFKVTDATSGMVDKDNNKRGQMKVEYSNDNTTWTNVHSEDQGWEAYATEKEVTLSGEDGLKYARVTFKDIAGNISSTSNSVSTEYDTKDPAADLLLVNKNNKTVPARTNDAEFKAIITGYDDAPQTGTAAYYALYGDFVGGKASFSDITDADWVAFTENPMTTDLKTFKKENADNTIYVAVKDNAGRIKSGVSYTTYLDRTLPEAIVQNIDHQNISKVHTPRDTSGTHSPCTCYADEVKFDVQPSEHIQAYFIAAYDTFAKATTGYAQATDKDAWVLTQKKYKIGNTYGSINMSGDGLDSASLICCTIKGADYEEAIKKSLDEGVTSADGVHFVVAYIQDLSGTWSACAGSEVAYSSSTYAGHTHEPEE